MTKKLVKKRYFIISNDTYKQDILFCLNMDNKEALKILKKLNSEVTKEDEEYILGDKKEFEKVSVQATTYILSKGYLVIAKQYKDSFRENLCIILHEIMHVTHYILRNIRIPLEENTEEAYTYLMEDLTRKVLFKLYK